jgi:hypothetical protein
MPKAMRQVPPPREPGGLARLRSVLRDRTGDGVAVLAERCVRVTKVADLRD